MNIKYLLILCLLPNLLGAGVNQQNQISPETTIQKVTRWGKIFGYTGLGITSLLFARSNLKVSIDYNKKAQRAAGKSKSTEEENDRYRLNSTAAVTHLCNSPVYTILGGGLLYKASQLITQDDIDYAKKILNKMTQPVLKLYKSVSEIPQPVVAATTTGAGLALLLGHTYLQKQAYDWAKYSKHTHNWKCYVEHSARIAIGSPLLLIGLYQLKQLYEERQKTAPENINERGAL